MPCKFLSLSIVVLLAASAQAGTKLVPLTSDPEGAILGVYDPDPLVRPTGTAVVICNSGKSQALEQAILGDLGKAGCAGFLLQKSPSPLTSADVARAFDYLQAHAAEYHIHPEKLGLLALDGSLPAGTATEPFAFLGLIDPMGLPKGKASSRAVFIAAAPDKSADVLRFYSKAARSGVHIDLHLEGPAMPDGARSTQWIDWLGSLGYLKPLSEEKTEALKSKEAWDNLAKFYDDKLHKDWASLTRYEDDNARLGAPAAGEQRVIYMGDSITDSWINDDPGFFRTNQYIDRGIGGQTTPQMVVRFREDVVNLHPQVVIILAGINDIAENTGPSKIENVAGNIFTMCELATVHGCKPILCSVLPTSSFPWHPGIDPIPPILKLNALLQDYAREHHLSYVDYYSALVAGDKGMQKDRAKDGLHPNLAGYKVMEPLAKAAIDQTLAEQP